MKLNNKGLTIVELLVVIILIGVLGIIITNYISKLVNNVKDDTSLYNEASIKKAASMYIDEFKDNINWNSDNGNKEYACISIKSLINKGYLKDIDLGSVGDKVIIRIERNKYNYVILDEILGNSCN